MKRPHRMQRVCRVCGCTNRVACVDSIGQPCHWVARNLCSQCVPRAVPTKNEILEALRDEAKIYHNSYVEVDGAVRDASGKWTIACLKAAIEIIKGGAGDDLEHFAP